MKEKLDLITGFEVLVSCAIGQTSARIRVYGILRRDREVEEKYTVIPVSHGNISITFGPEDVHKILKEDTGEIYLVLK